MPQIATGSYVGDGTDGRPIITGLSGALVLVSVLPVIIGVLADGQVNKTPGMAGKTVQSDFSASAVAVAIVGADFTVDGPAATVGCNMNSAGVAYEWVAWSE